MCHGGNTGDVTDLALRARALLEGWGTVLAALLCVLALTGGWATYTAHVAPGTTTEQRTETVWRSTGTYSHAATVTEPNPVFDVGERLSNRTRYYSSVAPELSGEFAFRYTGEGGVRAAADSALVYRSVSGDGTVYWSQREPVGSGTATLDPGESLAVPFAVNVSELEERVGAAQAGLGAGSDTVEAFVRTNVTLSGTVGGEPVERTLTHRLDIGTGGGTYTVSDPGVLRHSGERTEAVTVPRSHGAPRSLGGPALLVLSLAGLAGVAWARSEGYDELSARERAVLDYRRERGEFEEWISAVRLPAETRELPSAEAESLGDLVDVGIDAEAPVLETPEGVFVVLHGDYRYRYVPPTHPDWEGGSGGEDGPEGGGGNESTGGTAADENSGGE
jgi:hypothetical protein